MPYNFVVTIFKQRNFVADFLLVKCTFFHGKRLFCVFEPQMGLRGATYAVYLRLIGKLVVDVRLVIIELFSHRINR